MASSNGGTMSNLKRMLICLVLLLFAISLAAQTTTHKVVLTWTDTLNPTGTTYTVLRATGLCSGTPAFSTLASGITVLTYTDTTVTPGNYCYEVEASVGGVLSPPSNTALAPVPAFAPQTLSVTVQ
jgi:hypothetical protein